MAKKKTTTETNKLLTKAEKVAAGIEIVNVRLYQCDCQYAHIDDGAELSLQHRARVARHQNGDALRVIADFKLSLKNHDSEDESNDDDFFIKASFCLDYEDGSLSAHADEELEAFAAVNGPYNAWPFWREFAYSTMARMGLTPLTLPVFRIADQFGK